MVDRDPIRPNARPAWDDLYRVAEGQAGYFTRGDAAKCGFSSPLLHHHVAARALQRVRRGVYRLSRFPPSDHEDLVIHWLWSERRGVFSHETALALHELSDALPARAHLTLPQSVRARRVTVPDGVVVHFADLPATDRTWFGSLPVTSADRTLRDMIENAGDPVLIRQALTQAKRRGLLAREVAQRLGSALRAREGKDT
jgi:predicted transcriptional regulator of viral defense system